VLLGIGFLHRPWPAGPVWLLPAIVLIVVVIAFLSTELPTWRALRMAPAAALASGR
jgi:putative ABC transport system permease protein